MPVQFPKSRLDEILAGHNPVIADGATGSELQRRGITTPVPFWSAAALLTDGGRQTLAEIHRDYVAAGARIITANTFRTHARNLRAAGLADQASALTTLAVRIARRGIDEAFQGVDSSHVPEDILVAGSLAPLEDCYSPHLTPGDDQLRDEHRQMANQLAAAGCDLILIETMPTVREAAIAAEAARKTNLPLAVCFVCDASGKILSGQSLAEGVQAVAPFSPRLVGVNCAPATAISEAVMALKTCVEQIRSPFSEIDLIAYGNIGQPDAELGWRNTEASVPETYADLATGWREQGVRVIGGCCGTTPAHIAAMSMRIVGP